MHIINILRDIWTRYGGGFNNLSRSEQVEILHGVWTFSLALGVFACIAMLFVMLARLIQFLTQFPSQATVYHRAALTGPSLKKGSCMLFESVIFGLLPIIVGILVVAMVFESCWRKCPPDKLMIVSGAGKMRSVSGKGTFVIPLLQRVDTLSLGAVQVQLTTENEIPTQDAILIHACAVANFQIGHPPRADRDRLQELLEHG